MKNIIKKLTYIVLITMSGSSSINCSFSWGSAWKNLQAKLQEQKENLIANVQTHSDKVAGEATMFGFTIGLGALAFGLLSGCWQSKK